MTEIAVRRAVRRHELEALLNVKRRLLEEDMPSVEELEHVLAAEPESAFFLAHVGNEVAGSGVARPSSISGCLYAMARVLPELRGRGVGSALYRTLSNQAREVGRGSLVGRIRADDAASLEFARKRGFTEISRELPVVLDLTAADVEPVEAPAGVEIASLADRPELERSAWEVDVEAAPDIPTGGEMRTAPFERWRSLNLEGPSALPDATFVAIADGTVVGYAQLARLADDVAEHGLTAVRRAWRGRGIATALKQAQIAWAREAGFTQLRTSNDEANAAMRSINARLGYEPEPAWLILQGPLS